MANAAKQLGVPFDEPPAKPVDPSAEAPRPQPSASNGIPEDRRGFGGYVDGRFVHYCPECGEWAAHGIGLFLRRGQLGVWYCAEHKPKTLGTQCEQNQTQGGQALGRDQRHVACHDILERPLMTAEDQAEGQGIVMCPRCLSEDDFDAKREHHAAKMEKRARWLRTLVRHLDVSSRAVLKEFARPEDIEQAAKFWDSLSDLLKESELLPINPAPFRPSRMAETKFRRRGHGLVARRDGGPPALDGPARGAPGPSRS